MCKLSREKDEEMKSKNKEYIFGWLDDYSGLHRIEPIIETVVVVLEGHVFEYKSIPCVLLEIQYFGSNLV